MSQSVYNSSGVKMRSSTLLIIICSLLWRIKALPTGFSTSCLYCPEGPEFWMNPCASEVVKINSTLDSEASRINNLSIRALGQITYYINEFCTNQFNQNFSSQVNSDALFHYDWIYEKNKIPKNIGQILEGSHYSSIGFQSLLAAALEFFRREAVGLEHIVYEGRYSNLMNENFIGTRNLLQNLLCQIERAHVNLDILRPEIHPTRDIMSSVLRNPGLDLVLKDERNFRIIKAYVNLLEYYRDGFKYFSEVTAKAKIST